jgi:hypothetical protein
MFERSVPGREQTGHLNGGLLPVETRNADPEACEQGAHHGAAWRTVSREAGALRRSAWPAGEARRLLGVAQARVHFPDSSGRGRAWGAQRAYRTLSRCHYRAGLGLGSTGARAPSAARSSCRARARRRASAGPARRPPAPGAPGPPPCAGATARCCTPPGPARRPPAQLNTARAAMRRRAAPPSCTVLHTSRPCAAAAGAAHGRPAARRAAAPGPRHARRSIKP